MLRKVVTIAGLLALASSTLLADFSYQETGTITGGMMKSLMKMAGVFNKNAREAEKPIVSTVAVKGDKMVRRNDLHMSVVDLSAKTITSVDMQKKTYTVMTFEQMKQMMQQMSERMHQQDPNDPQMQIKVSAAATGKTKAFSGMDAKEMLVKIEMQSTDPKTGKTGSLPITVDSWIAPAADGYGEVRAFYKRMADEIGWTPGGNMFMSRPEVAKGMAEAEKEVSALNGMPVFETMNMGMTGQPGSDGQSGANGQTDAPPQDQSAQQQSQSQRPSLGGLLGSRMGISRSRSSSSQPKSSGNANSGSLLEMTVEMSGFSSRPVEAGQFAIPDGFKQVEADARRMQQ
jgi:hypothetical protein